MRRQAAGEAGGDVQAGEPHGDVGGAPPGHGDQVLGGLAGAVQGRPTPDAPGRPRRQVDQALAHHQHSVSAWEGGHVHCPDTNVGRPSAAPPTAHRPPPTAHRGPVAGVGATLVVAWPDVQPIELGPNQPRHFYRGGEAIAALRGTVPEDHYRPEDWVASTTSRFGQGDLGQSRLPDGRQLADAVSADPEAWLGPDHHAFFGTDTALLVKLLDVGQRLPVHVHPDRAFAYRHLGSRHGKTECWLVLGVSGAEPSVFLGWSRDIEYHEMFQWVEEQDAEAMLANMNRLTVKPGASVLVPAGTPHAIGAGIFCAELQEPTDFSIMLETAGFDLDRSEGELGLGREEALSCIREKALSSSELEALQRRNSPFTEAPAKTGAFASEKAEDQGDLLAPTARPYFRAQHLGQTRPGPVEPSFAVLIGTWGEGRLVGGDWEMPVRRGSTIVVPWAAGPIFVNGPIEMIRCLPPLPVNAAFDFH